MRKYREREEEEEAFSASICITIDWHWNRTERENRWKASIKRMLPSARKWCSQRVLLFWRSDGENVCWCLKGKGLRVSDKYAYQPHKSRTVSWEIWLIRSFNLSQSASEEDKNEIAWVIVFPRDAFLDIHTRKKLKKRRKPLSKINLSPAWLRNHFISLCTLSQCWT